MKRREFITLLGGAAAWPITARAQQGMRRVAVLSAHDEAQGKRYFAAFKAELEGLGWVDRRNILIDFREESDTSRLPTLAGETVGTHPDVILAMTVHAVSALRQQRLTTPLIFAQVSDPVDGGLVASMARPGGNMTGFTSFEYSLSGKWLELLKEAAPSLSRVMVIYNPDNYTSRGLLRTIEGVAQPNQTGVIPAPVLTVIEIEAAVSTFAQEPQGGLIFLPDPVNAPLPIAALAAAHRLPTIHQAKLFAEAGGLMSYGPDFLDLYRRAASYVDRVLKGEKVGELPVQNPTKFELVINLRTAKAIGLEVPWFLQQRADEVIE
jgi:putative tryptophan/tyrosine transport system substrate-binding protein